MKVNELLTLIEAENLTPAAELEKEILCGYTCDLLSWVMKNGQEGMAWVTVQTHMNVIAVAALLDFACVIVPEKLPVDPAIVAKAAEEGIVMLASEKTAYELVEILSQNGVPSAKKG